MAKRPGKGRRPSQGGRDSAGGAYYYSAPSKKQIRTPAAPGGPACFDGAGEIDPTKAKGRVKKPLKA